MEKVDEDFVFLEHYPFHEKKARLVSISSSLAEDGVPVFDSGPIGARWNAGFDGDEKPLTGFSTSFVWQELESLG